MDVARLWISSRMFLQMSLCLYESFVHPISRCLASFTMQDKTDLTIKAFSDMQYEAGLLIKYAYNVYFTDRSQK